MSTTIQRALDQAIEQLTQAQLPTSPDYHTARLDAQVLLSHVLHVERSTLYTYPERALTSEQEQRYFSLIQRRAQGAPVAYLTGYKEFYGLDFLVDERVLIPRPTPELLVTPASQACRSKPAAAKTPDI